MGGLRVSLRKRTEAGVFFAFVRDCGGVGWTVDEALTDLAMKLRLLAEGEDSFTELPDGYPEEPAELPIVRDGVRRGDLVELLRESAGAVEPWDGGDELIAQLRRNPVTRVSGPSD